MDYVTPQSGHQDRRRRLRRPQLPEILPARDDQPAPAPSIVGTEESVVHLAEVKAREDRIAIPTRRIATTRETSGVAATVLRSVDDSKAFLPQPQLTLYGASPLVEAKGRGKLVLRRLDLAGERQQIDLGGTQLKGRFFDFASENVALVPGGLYAATFKSSQIVFRVDAQAKPGATPIVGRLLRME